MCFQFAESFEKSRMPESLTALYSIIVVSLGT
jgi:hypothetical protein